MKNKKVDPFQSGNEPLTDKEMKRYEKTKGVLFKPNEITCPNGCGFYAYEGSEGSNEMNAHLRIDCKPGHTPGGK